MKLASVRRRHAALPRVRDGLNGFQSGVHLDIAHEDRGRLLALVDQYRAVLLTLAQGCGCTSGKACACVTDYASKKYRELDGGDAK